MINHFKIYSSIILIVLYSISLYSQVITNEFMAQPVGDEPEWIELYNTTASDISIKGYTISDFATTKKLPNFTLPAKGFAILAKNSATLTAIRKIPTSAVIVEMSMPGLNNTNDAIVLKNETGKTIDSVFYDMKWGFPGISLERKYWGNPAISKENLLPSTAKDSSTPGHTNSVAPRLYDLKFSNIKYKTNNSSLDLVIHDIGIKKIDRFYLTLYLDKNNDGVFLDNETVFSEIYENSNNADSVLLNISAIDLINMLGRYGFHTIKGLVFSPDDEFMENDTFVSKFYLPAPKGDILINEFLFDNDASKSEFVELYNASDDTLDLAQWSIRNRIANNSTIITIDKPRFLIAPKGYCVIAWDSTIAHHYPILKNSETVFVKHNKNMNLRIDDEEIVLMNPNAEVYDSLSYKRSWHNQALTNTRNISLEKINPVLSSINKNSWTSCTASEGATPNSKNSVMQKITKQGKLITEPNPFSPKGADGKQFCIISFELPYKQSKLYIEIFDVKGNSVALMANSDLCANHGNYTWNGKDNQGNFLPVGQYVLLLEATDIETSQVHRDKTTIVIGQ